MTPGARAAAAIEILDLYLAGQPLEKVLTNWARRSRFAGSKDRAAIRDIVFDRVRRRASCQTFGGRLTGRALVLGGMSHETAEGLFSGEGHAPAQLSDIERAVYVQKFRLGWSALTNMPGWLRTELETSLGEDCVAECSALSSRAITFLRVNVRKTSIAKAQESLRTDGVETEPHPLAETALTVTENPRRVANSAAHDSGLVELQDAASQALCAELPAVAKMLDYCAGGGGKVLAYGAVHDAELFAHDANKARLKDLPIRAERAGLSVHVLDQSGCQKNAPFDLVLCDVPCSGSGAWRRQPEGKWRLTQAGLDELTSVQQRILNDASLLVGPGGHLAYATCSLLNCENSAQVDAFLGSNSAFTLVKSRKFLPTEGGDGFYLAILQKQSKSIVN